MGNIDPGQDQETDPETDHIGDVVEADPAIVADAIADIEVEVGHVIVTVDTAEDKFLCVNNKLKLKNLWIQRNSCIIEYLKQILHLERWVLIISVKLFWSNVLYLVMPQSARQRFHKH